MYIHGIIILDFKNIFLRPDKELFMREFSGTQHELCAVPESMRKRIYNVAQSYKINVKTVSTLEYQSCKAITKPRNNFRFFVLSGNSYKF